MESLLLTPSQQEHLQALTSRGIASARVVRRAHVLRFLHEGRQTSEIAALLKICDDTVRLIRQRFLEHGFEAALWDRPRSGRPVEIDESAQQRIVALACATPPTGHARWTVRLLAQEAKAQHCAEHVGRETVRTLLKHHDLHPWREKNVVHSRGRSEVSSENGRRTGRLRTSV